MKCSTAFLDNKHKTIEIFIARDTAIVPIMIIISIIGNSLGAFAINAIPPIIPETMESPSNTTVPHLAQLKPSIRKMEMMELIPTPTASSVVLSLPAVRDASAAPAAEKKQRQIATIMMKRLGFIFFAERRA
mgnify:CR=1 FL=1